MGAIKELNHYSIPKASSPTCCNSNETDTSHLLPKNWLPNYETLEVEVLRPSFADGLTCQGGTTDGQYLYRALINTNDDLTTLQKIDINTGAIILSKTKRSYTHANDMTYCSKDGYLYIAHGSENNTLISKVDRATLEYVESFTIGSGIWSIAYNEVDDIWVVGVSGGYYFTVYNNKWELIYRLSPENKPTGYVKQSIHCDDNYIYGFYYDSINGGGIVNVVTYNGMFVKRYRIDLDYEPEFLAVVGDTMYLGFYEGRTNEVKYNSIYKAKFDFYKDQTANSMRPTDVEGGLGKLVRLPAGTQVCLWRGESKSNSIKIFSNKVTPTAFRYLKFVSVGSNQFVTDWFKGGRVRISETNMNDDAGNTLIYFREMLLIYNADTNSFDVEINITHKEAFNEDGTVTVLKEDIKDSATTQEFIYVSQVWGIV